MAKSANGNGNGHKSSVSLVPQDHGGALRVGNPGNKGSNGRPDLAVRTRCLESFAKRIQVFEEIADDPTKKDEVRIAAVEKLGRFGIPNESATFAAAQLETPDGFKFSLILGERDQPDD